MADDELSIYVFAPRNSGISSGELLKKQAVVNPDTGRPYLYAHLTVGALLKVGGLLSQDTG